MTDSKTKKGGEADMSDRNSICVCINIEGKDRQGSEEVFKLSVKKICLWLCV